jgi:hypothetical protein
VETVLASIAAGLVSGYLGVLLALKQFKEQRAFDRQLEWYERTIRALGRFSTLNREMALAPMFGNPDQTFKAWQELQKGLADLEQCINEAVLYAEQQSYEQLKTMGAQYEEIKGKADREAAVKESDTVAKVLRATLIELSKPIRKKLGLKKIILIET